MQRTQNTNAHTWCELELFVCCSSTSSPVSVAATRTSASSATEANAKAALLMASVSHLPSLLLLFNTRTFAARGPNVITQTEVGTWRWWRFKREKRKKVHIAFAQKNENGRRGSNCWYWLCVGAISVGKLAGNASRSWWTGPSAGRYQRGRYTHDGRWRRCERHGFNESRTAWYVRLCARP